MIITILSRAAGGRYILRRIRVTFFICKFREGTTVLHASYSKILPVNLGNGIVNYLVEITFILLLLLYIFVSILY